MLELSQMLIRFAAALALGGLLGLERELVGKEAGVRTCMIVAGGSAIFAIIGLVLPVATQGAAGGGAGVIASIVAGIGFLGGGIIIKTQERVHGLTTAAVVWLTAAIGVLAGIGLLHFAMVAALIIFVLLYLLRDLDVNKDDRSVRPSQKRK